MIDLRWSKFASRKLVNCSHLLHKQWPYLVSVSNSNSSMIAQSWSIVLQAASKLIKSFASFLFCFLKPTYKTKAIKLTMLWLVCLFRQKQYLGDKIETLCTKTYWYKKRKDNFSYSPFSPSFLNCVTHHNTGQHHFRQFDHTDQTLLCLFCLKTNRQVAEKIDNNSVQKKRY